jgi:hypothetical protein
MKKAKDLFDLWEGLSKNMTTLNATSVFLEFYWY